MPDGSRRSDLPADSSAEFRRRSRGSEYCLPSERLLRAVGGVAVYLLGFSVLLLAELHFFLYPAWRASGGSDPIGKQRLAAVAWLMFSILLVYLIAGLILVFRVGRFFFPRHDLIGPRVRTPQMDIWAEAGKRLKITPDPDAAGEEGDKPASPRDPPPRYPPPRDSPSGDTPSGNNPSDDLSAGGGSPLNGPPA